MIKSVYIDSNNTIEDFKSIKNNTDRIISDVSVSAQKQGINIDLEYAKKQLSFLNDLSPNTAWINHPFFWRNAIKDDSERKNPDIINNIYKEYLEQYNQYITLFPDAIDCLLQLKEKGLNLYLIANGTRNRIYQLIKKFDLMAYFKDVLISGETPFQKPDAFMFKYFAKRDNLGLSEIMMVGDKYETDIIGAKSLGISSTLIKRGHSDLPSKSLLCNPDFTIYSLSSLPYLIRKINDHSLSINNKKKESHCIKNHIIDTAVILAGGKGSRLGDIGKHTNKCMLLIDNIPILEHLINSLKNVGVSNYIIPVSHLSEQIIRYFGDGSSFSINIKYVDGVFASTSDALKECLKYVQNEFYYCHGNIFFQNDILESLAYCYLKNRRPVISYLKEDTQIKHIKIGIDDNSITTSVSNEYNESSTLTFSGLAIYIKDILLNYLSSSSMTEEFMDNAIKDRQIIDAIPVSGYYYHVETHDDYLEVEHFLS